MLRGSSPFDQVHAPLLSPRTASDLLEMETFKDWYKYSQWHQDVTNQKLSPFFSHYRNIRGDGNCGYRAVYILYIELLICEGPLKVKAFVGNLEENKGLFKWD